MEFPTVNVSYGYESTQPPAWLLKALLHRNCTGKVPVESLTSADALTGGNPGFPWVLLHDLCASARVSEAQTQMAAMPGTRASELLPFHLCL